MANTTITQFPTGQTQYKINFDYLARTFVVVTLINSADQADNKVLTVGNDYRFITATTIELLADQTGFDIVQIHRFTGTGLLVSFRDGSVLTSNDLTTSELQAIHIAEEGRDQTSGLAKQYADQAIAAGTDAQSILDNIIKMGKNGYTPVGSFEAGATVNLQNDAVQFGTGAAITHWRWEGTLPKVVPPNSTPTSTGGIGHGKWIDVTDATLRGALAQLTGASLVMTSNGKTVEERLSGTLRVVDSVKDLESLVPQQDGEIVIARWAAYPKLVGVNCGPVGGGMFIAYNDNPAVPKDGGFFVDSPSPTLKWRRMAENTGYYPVAWWGVIPDHYTDNADNITRAHNFAKRAWRVLQYDFGTYLTSKAVPIYSRMGIKGTGRADGTVIAKTTNDAFNLLKADGTVGEAVDALAVMVPDAYDRASPYMDSFCIHGRIEDIMFRRNGLSEANYNTMRPQYGLFMNKGGSPVLKHINFEGAYIGIRAYVCFSSTISAVATTNWRGKGYAGLYIEDYRDGSLMSSGTSNDIRLFQARGYQHGVSMSRMQYTTMVNCSVEECFKSPGETYAYAYKFIDPFSIHLSTCATEFVEGGQIQITGFANPGLRPSITITEYLAVDQQNPATAHNIIDIDNGGVARCTVKVIGGDWTHDPRTPNVGAPRAAGSGTVVTTIGTTGAEGPNWLLSGGAKVVDIENATNTRSS